MPLSRYQVRNEYSLADPELYKSADKDDPEALLEGVAMAGLVGVLRQLGDLAEFAAEVFHNLHEEVMATAARGHSLTARVQQLEVEFPLIEKAFLSQTNHSAFFYNAGIDWHPNMHIDQNYITRGDLPRFVRDSHEEARGPPRLFLLDKFDVAGAGACLKRFTDPSFYKVEVITNGDIQRDKKVRKGKRRGSRWKNGETPEVLTTPHAKLHQLLLEERIENSASDPTRRVKLKRRLNGFPFVLKTGKSYMEKILLTPPPDYRELHEVYNYSSSPLKILGSNFMPELEKDDFGSESPDVEFAQRSPSMSPDLKDGSQNVSMSEMEFESSNGSYHFKPEFGPGEIGTESPDLQLTHRSPYLTPEKPDSVPNISTDQEFESLGIENKDFPEVMNSLEVDNIPTPLYEDPIEKQIIVDKESKSEGSAGYKSVDFASDAENYMDALATMESEMETDSELREKGNLHVLSNRKRITSPGASTPLRETHFSDSQSIGSSTLSDDGNSSSKKCKSNSSYSGSPHILARKAYLEDELSDLIDSSNEGETKSISRPLKWRGRTRIAGGNKISAIPTYSSARVVKTFPNTDASPGSMVHGDADASVGDNGVSKLKLEGMLSVEGVPEDEDEPSNVNKSESSMSVNLPSGSSVSATHLQTEYDSINRVVHENHYSNNGEDSHMIESSSCKPTMSDDTCFTEGSKNQQMEEIVDKNILYMVHNVTPAPCTLDGAPLSCEENLSSPEKNHLGESSNEGPRMSEHPLKESPASCTVDGIPLNSEDNLFSPENQPLSKSANDSPRMSERSLNPSPQEVSENGLQEDLSNHEIGANEVLGVFHRGSVHSSSCTEDTAEEEMSKQSLENMPQAGDGEDDFEVYPVVSPSDSQITIMPPAAEQPTELRFPVLETNDRETDAESTDDNQNRTVSSPNSENLQISGMAYILQPLDPVDSTTNDQIEEQFPDLSLSGTEHSSDGTDHNVILSGGNNMASLGGEIAVEVEKQAPSGILEGVCSEDIQAPVVLDRNVETPDNGDENLHEFPSLAVRVETDVVPALETDLVNESPSVRPEISAFNEMQTSDTADDMLLLNSTRVGTSSEQIENLHELESLVGQKLEGVSSSTYLGARSTVDGEVIDGILSTDVDFGKTQSNQYPVDTKVPLAIMCSESGTEEKGNILKVASQSMDYDHTESRILVNSSNSYPESESSLHTDITASSTPEQSGSHMNVIRAEKNKLEDDTMESLPMRMYCYMEDQNVNLPLHQPDEKETEVFRMRGESNLDLNVADPSVLEQSESSSKWVDSDKGVLTSYTQDTSPVSTHRDEEGQKIRLPLHHLDEEINQVSTVKGYSNVVLEPQLTDRQNVDRLLSQDGISGIASISFSRNLPGQQSASELFPREKPKIDDGCQHNEPLGSVSPTLGLLPEAVNSDEVEMPPLPPLPPAQWRMGKTQPSSLAYEKTVLPNNNNLFPSISLGSNSNFLTLRELQPLNNLAAVTEFDSPNQNLLLPANNSKSSSTSETLQNLLLPAKLDEMPQHDDDTCTSLSASSSGTNGDAAADACDVELVAGSSSLVQYDNAEATSQTKLSHQGSASSENNAGTHDASGLLTKIEDEWPQNMMLSLEGVAWPTQEEGKPYGIRPMKLPRQRNPLIDAVIALDKSKLRKVTEQPRTHIQKADELDSVLENLQLRKVSEQPRTQIQKVNDRDSVLENMQLRKVAEHPRPQIQEADERDSALENLQLRKVPKQTRPQMQEADERDSLLEQIRAKSFNLKPPVVSKPAVQGPTTNLKLAAILEKAKTIRQAFAGSDEDDDDDSWSDS